MRLRRKVLFFTALLIFHIILLYLFVLGFYAVYFIALFCASYLVYKYYDYFSYTLFFSLSTFVIVLINMNIYDEYLFELYLYFDALDKNIYVNSEVMYGLIALHMIVLINLKKFESFWVIIDKKIFRN